MVGWMFSAFMAIVGFARWMEYKSSWWCCILMMVFAVAGCAIDSMEDKEIKLPADCIVKKEGRYERQMKKIIKEMNERA